MFTGILLAKAVYIRKTAAPPFSPQQTSGLNLSFCVKDLRHSQRSQITFPLIRGFLPHKVKSVKSYECENTSTNSMTRSSMKT